MGAPHVKCVAKEKDRPVHSRGYIEEVRTQFSGHKLRRCLALRALGLAIRSVLVKSFHAVSLERPHIV